MAIASNDAHKHYHGLETSILHTVPENLYVYEEMYDEQLIVGLLWSNAKVIHREVAEILIKRVLDTRILEEFATEGIDADIRRLARKGLSLSRLMADLERKDLDACVSMLDALEIGLDSELAQMVISRRSQLIAEIAVIEVSVFDSIEFINKSRPTSIFL